MPIMITLAGDALPRYRGPMASEVKRGGRKDRHSSRKD